MANAQWSEEQFLLRVREPRALAERLNAALSEENAEPGVAPLEMELNWTDERKGELRVGNETFPARLLDLPTVVESWKSYDGTNLVKSADVGQMVVIGPAPSEDTTSPDGLTIATRNVQQHLFKKPTLVDPQVLGDVERQLVDYTTKGLSGLGEQVTHTFVEEFVDILEEPKTKLRINPP